MLDFIIKILRILLLISSIIGLLAILYLATTPEFHQIIENSYLSGLFR